jgi:hypothetical protein
MRKTAVPVLCFSSGGDQVLTKDGQLLLAGEVPTVFLVGGISYSAGLE